MKTTGIAVVANSQTGFRYELLAGPNQNVLDLFAMHEGYGSWKEMRRYASPLDLEEFWTVTWALEPTVGRAS